MGVAQRRPVPDPTSTHPQVFEVPHPLGWIDSRGVIERKQLSTSTLSGTVAQQSLPHGQLCHGRRHLWLMRSP